MTNPTNQTQTPPEEEPIDAEIKEVIVSTSQSLPEKFLPVLTLSQAVERYEVMKQFVGSCLTPGKDYGKIPGTKKNTLYKPGAEKLTTFFGFRVLFIDDGSTERWDENDPFFYYHRKCQLWKGNTLIAEASGSANSREKQFRWRWVDKDNLPPNIDITSLITQEGRDGIFEWQFEKRTTTGKYGKPEAYYQMIDNLLAQGKISKSSEAQPWDGAMADYLSWDTTKYRIPNDDIYTLVNTILKMAEKRALVAATLIGCNASDYFTQDMEDLAEISPIDADNGDIPQTEIQQITPETAIKIARGMWEEGTFTGNDFLRLGEALLFEKDVVFEIKRKYEIRDEKDKLDHTDFEGAARELIEKYNEING